jgi:methionyl-tRNA formyltransferase
MNKRVIFMGTPDYADQILKALIDDNSIDVVALFTQPDKPVGRKKILTPPPPKLRAVDAGIEVFQPDSLKKEDFSQTISELEPDYIVVAAYGQILPKAILDIAPCINLHASILPAYRGASPIQQALLAGDTITGVTAMLMDVGMDTGDIIAIETYDIPKDMVSFELFDALTHVAVGLTLEVLHNFDSYTIKPQDETNASYCKKIQKSDGEVSFSNAQALVNRYRAFTPWPGIYLASGLKLKEITLAQATGNYEQGRILAIEKDRIEVGCQEGSIYLYRVQPVSKKEMDIKSFINGQRLTVEDCLA